VDPVALICRIFDLSIYTTEYRDGKNDLHRWYVSGGFRPTVREVVDALHQQAVLPDDVRDKIFDINNTMLVNKLVNNYGCTLP
jgi:hypothetical protein